MASDWLSRFEGAGLDGVMVKPANGTYEPGKRAMIKVKHSRTADRVVAGFRWHKTGKHRPAGSLLLGLYDDKGMLHHVGVTSSFTMAMRERLALELAPLQDRALEQHPWRGWADAGPAAPKQAAEIAAKAGSETNRMPGGQSRWSAGKDLSWEPLRIELVCEVSTDHMQGNRFRHAAIFQRWRPDRTPSDCRYDQLEVTTPTSSRRSSARPARAGDVVWIERFLRRPQPFRNVFEIHADSCPRVKPATHGVHKHVGRLKIRGGIDVPIFPALETCERVLFALCASDFYERAAGLPATRRLHTRRLSSLFSIMWRPRRIPQTFAFLLRGKLEQRSE